MIMFSVFREGVVSDYSCGFLTSWQIVIKEGFAILTLNMHCYQFSD